MAGPQTATPKGPKKPLSSSNRHGFDNLLNIAPADRSSSINWEVLKRLAEAEDAGSPSENDPPPTTPRNNPVRRTLPVQPPKSKGKRTAPDDDRIRSAIPSPSPPELIDSPASVQTGPAPPTRRFGEPLDFNSSFSPSIPPSSSSLRPSSQPAPRPSKLQKKLPRPSAHQVPTPPRPPPTIACPQSTPHAAPTPSSVETPSGNSRSGNAHAGARRPVPPIPTPNSTSTSTAIDNFLSLHRLSGRRKPFCQNVNKPFRDAAAKAANEYLAHPSESNLLRFLELPKRWLTPALQTSDELTAKQRLGKFMTEEGDKLPWPKPIERDSDEERDVAYEARKLVQLGRLGSACTVLTEDTEVAEPDDVTLDQIEGKHPPGPTDPFSLPRYCTGPAAATAPSKKEVLSALNSFDADTAPGLG
ncbi:hypothetical protein IAT40_006203 [Kwoniella sp. CBS 6097]